MIAWRISRERYRALDGEGARLNGGRWNPEGMPVVYASTTLALAALEYLVHVDPEDVPDDLVALRIEIPDDVRADHVDVADLPSDWNLLPDHTACVARGAAWIREGRSALLRVPSALVPEEENLLINPTHADAARIAATAARPFAFDPRLLGRA